MLGRAGLVALLLGISTCVMGAPPGFSSGDVWSFPLVAPFEDGALYAPVKINGKGPYLFKIDPDSPVTSVDAGLRSSLDLYTRRVRDLLDERDRLIPIALAEVITIQVGTLTVRNRRVLVHNVGSFWAGGRKVRGVLGRDVLADSLIFVANRDRGMGYIAKQGKLAPSTDAIKVGYSRAFERRIVTAKVNGKKLTLHLDLGGHTNTLWSSKMGDVGLQPVRLRALQVDEFGTKHLTTVGGISQSIQVGSAVQYGQMFIPYTDKRIRETDIDGTIGMNFFAHYNVTANWHKRTFWLQKRATDAGTFVAERLRRFGPIFDGCKSPACVSIRVVGGPAATASPAPDSMAAPPVPSMPPSLEITVEPMALPRYEILIEALDGAGKPVGTRLIATLRKGTTTLVERNIDSAFLGAKSFRVIDVNPFPRECEKRGNNLRCVWPLVLRR